MDVPSIDTVLFDFGGTLDAPGVHWLTRFHRLYAQVGLAVAPEHIKEAFYWADAQLLAHPSRSTRRRGPSARCSIRKRCSR